ncbi:MAG: cell division topological specificity factor MinE [Nevskiaceae bacterium]|jgi:cell division topological specificity factor|nr:cell division topological specificity factor MinE [Nevskiaceae bacterium]
MGLLAFFRRSQPTASTAKERLRIIVAQERKAQNAPDYLPTLRRELLEVIRKYINIDPDAVQINLEQEDGRDLLEFTVTLPDNGAGRI